MQKSFLHSALHLFCDQVFQKFPELHSGVSLHLIEVSPALSKIQEKTLTGRIGNVQENEKTDNKSQSNEVRLSSQL